VKQSKRRSERRRAAKAKDPHRYPKGWNRKRVEAVVRHYENQSEDEAVAEDEAVRSKNMEDPA
jgi:hypothetical protein